MSGSVLFKISIPADKETEKICCEIIHKKSIKILKDILLELKIKNPIWIRSSEDGIKDTYRQILFYIENGPETEEAIKLLTENDIGVTPHSSIGLFQCYLLYEGSKESSPRIKVTSPKDDSYSWEKFMESVRPRLAISKIVESIKQKATLTFDFVVLLIVAALTASLGLVEDSQLILTSSMLMSPMMFPMIATTFGTVIGQWKLQRLGMANGLFGLIVCLTIGFIFGIGASLVQGYCTVNEWPTSLMYSMGTVSSLVTGAILAILSGTALSIGILGDDAGSLQGVAISAALLPPAVNAGLLWSRCVLITAFPSFPGKSRQIWSSNPPVELALLGAISLALSFLNILFIFLAGNLVLKVKEAAPWKHKTDATWRRLRQFRPLSKEETEHITIRLQQELGKNHHWTVSPNIITPHKMVRGLETWSGRCKYKERRPTAQDLAHLLAPPQALKMTDEIHSSGGSSTRLISPDPEVNYENYGMTGTPQSSRFTVVPVASQITK